MGDEQKVRLLEASIESRRKGRRATAIASLFAVVFATIAGGTLYYWHQTQRALDESTAMIAALVEAASDAAQANPSGEKIEAQSELLRKAISRFAATSGDPRV